MARGRSCGCGRAATWRSTALEAAISKEAHAAHPDAGPARAPLAAPPRGGEPATDGACGLNLSQSPQPAESRARVAIVGATGTGKTALALELARRLPGRYELVSVDAMAVYRFLDLGTAKPTPAERAAAPWHLIDIVDPSEEFSVAAFQAEARRAPSRGSTPAATCRVLVGGTGLYHRAVVDALEIPARFPERGGRARAPRPSGPAVSRSCSAAFASWTRSRPAESSRATGAGSCGPSR